MRLTSLSHGAGCACKLSLDELRVILDGLPKERHPELLVGHDTGDDAAVWRAPDGRLQVATTDFFTPIVDDPRDWGRIAATNAVSDVYAMGATPRVALNLVGWPRDLPFELLAEVLAGAQEVAAAAGYAIAGGHSIDSQEPLFGQAIYGDMAPEDLLTNAGARPGDVLVLTKPIGTGIVTTALKRSDGDPDGVPGYRAAVASMTRLNDHASAAARAARAHAATDVTGFGLLGHAHRLAHASGVSITVDAASVPLIDGVISLVAAGFIPGGTARNAEQARRFLGSDADESDLTVLCDAQTSGGLLIALPAADAPALVAALADTSPETRVVGTVGDGPAGTIHVDGHVDGQVGGSAGSVVASARSAG
jgi:selenide,water dikinase